MQVSNRCQAASGSRHRCSHLHSRRPVAVLSLRERRSRTDVSISSHCNLHKGGSCGCLGVAGASASFERGSLGFNEPIQFGLIRPIHYATVSHIHHGSRCKDEVRPYTTWNFIELRLCKPLHTTLGISRTKAIWTAEAQAQSFGCGGISNQGQSL